MITGAEDVGALLHRLGVVRHGHFRLSSGLHSDLYLQCQIALSQPAVALELGRALADGVRDPVDVVASPALGGIVAGFVVATALDRRFVFAERDPQGRFTFRRGQGMEPGERVLVVEDVITTGGSAAEVATVARAAGARIVGTACLVDRSGGLPVDRRPAPAPLSLLALRPAAWQPDACPRCAEGSPLDSPGSRHRDAGGAGSGLPGLSR